MPHLIAYSASNASFGFAWRNMVMEPPRRELKRLLKRGIEKSELAPNLDVDLSLALLLGPIIYWHVFLRRTSENPKGLAEGVVEAFWRAFGLKKALSKGSVRARPRAVDEVRAAKNIGPTAEKTLGLREIRSLIAGEISRTECIAQIQQLTRRYAKRQLTWFRRQTNFPSLNLSAHDPAEAVEIISQSASRVFLRG